MAVDCTSEMVCEHMSGGGSEYFAPAQMLRCAVKAQRLIADFVSAASYSLYSKPCFVFNQLPRETSASFAVKCSAVLISLSLMESAVGWE